MAEQRDVGPKASAKERNFRVFGRTRRRPTSVTSIRSTDRAWVAETLSYDDHRADGRVMEILSEHTCQGWLEGYFLTRKAMAFSRVMKRLSISSIRCSTSMPSGLRPASHIPWRRPIASLNYLLTSARVVAALNGFPDLIRGFIDHVCNKKADVVPRLSSALMPIRFSM